MKEPLLQARTQKAQQVLNDTARTLVQSKESIVTALLQHDVALDVIMHATKLTKEQVLAIKAQQKGQNDDKH